MNRVEMDNPVFSRTLAAQLDVDPPPALRAQVLGRYRRRRRLQTGLPMVLMAGLALGTALMLRPRGPQTHEDLVWQQRSAELELMWRQTGDQVWLHEDARARELLRRLREVDQSLAVAHADAGDEGRLEALWRQRTEVLAALVETRRQGGTAIRL